MYKNIMLKISGESLAGSNEQGFDFDILNDLSENIKILTSQDIRVSIVLGGGNFIRGASFSNGVVDRVTSDYMGMLGTVINSLALQSNLEKIGVPSRVMTALSINRVAEPYIKNKATRHLEKKRVVIFASGTGNPFFSTDTAAVLRASEMKSDIILKGTKVDGIYDKDPISNKDATKIEKISYSDFLNKEIKVMDATAISLAKDRSLPIIIFSIMKSSNIIDIIKGKGSYSLIN
ncbi:UMP kinase [Alphaproteobacteria bacterium]|jgi:uridylate kinase|nr:UMP kinase [Alphaproteobacteria bacterium]MDB2360136.1 UMP kinase [Alphaproteobacteria bacterium]